MHPVQTTVNLLKRQILIGRGFITGQELVDTGVQHGGIAAYKPAHRGRLADQHLAVKAQLGHQRGPTFGNRLFDNGQMKDPGLHHLQHIFHRQARVDPLHLHRGQFAQRELLIDQADGLTGRAARGQCHCAPGQLLKPGKTPLALLPHQQQRHPIDHRITRAHRMAGLDVQQLTRRHQVAFATHERTE